MKLLALLSLLSFPAFAQDQIWTYSGAQLSDGTTVTGDIILSQALNPNEANQVVTPLSFAFTDSAATNSFMNSSWVNSTSGTGSSDSFLFSTKNGQVVGWTFDISSGTFGSAYNVNQTFVSTQAGDTYSTAVVINGCYVDFQPDPDCTHTTASNQTAGIVKDPPAIPAATSAPELGANQAASALTLLLGALAIVASSARSQSKSSAYRHH